MDAQPRLAPEGVLGFLHVAEEPAEMDDAGRVRFVELDPASQGELGGHARCIGCSCARAGRTGAAANRRAADLRATAPRRLRPPGRDTPRPAATRTGSRTA